VLLHGQLLNGPGEFYWQASVLNRDITSSGRKGVERERGEWPVFKQATLLLLLLTTHSVHNTPSLAPVDDVHYGIYQFCMIYMLVTLLTEFSVGRCLC
jgi:hypothetical protein